RPPSLPRSPAMTSSRRAFLERVATGVTGASMFGALPASMDAMRRVLDPARVRNAAAEKWDLGWIKRVKGKHQAIFYVTEKYIGRGGIALACNLAFDECVEMVQKADGSTPEAARAKAIGFLVPGVVLQPSGVFAALRAQEAGCAYLRAS